MSATTEIHIPAESVPFIRAAWRGEPAKVSQSQSRG